jgi:hypothetical protein
MKQRSIPFMADMIRAILEDRKTQTRRVITYNAMSGHPKEWKFIDENREYLKQFCKYGVPGDRLWVKETLMSVKCCGGNATVYAADSTMPLSPTTKTLYPWKWKPSKLGAMYCPRWASRITLEITDIRVQRLKEISAEDAVAEGMLWAKEVYPPSSVIADYGCLWNAINAKRRGCGWNANPWVWAISFKRVYA